jgi:hypothetical protein
MTQVFFVARSIELSNLDDITDMSRRSLIYVGLEKIEVQFFEEILVENGGD